jgi:hypothetical protein
MAARRPDQMTLQPDGSVFWVATGRPATTATRAGMSRPRLRPRVLFLTSGGSMSNEY